MPLHCQLRVLPLLIAVVPVVCLLAESVDSPGTLLKHGPTVVLYFLGPGGIEDIDVRMIKAISPWVPWIPIIAKADTYTKEELQTYRQQISEVRLPSAHMLHVHHATRGGE